MALVGGKIQIRTIYHLLNIYQYLYTLLLYMPDYKDSPTGIEVLMPWNDFVKEKCTGECE